MTTVLDALFLRRPKLNYISPAICEAVFSGSSGPVIILPDIAKNLGPTGLILSGHGRVTLSWNRYPGALCYNVYSQIDTDFHLACSDQHIIANTGNYQIIAECQEGTEIVLPAPGCYRISAITPDGESELSPAICTCDCPTCFCPSGTHYDPDFNQCVCDSQPCGPGFTWDFVQCKCVTCGSQQCPPSFFPDPTNPCNCIPGEGGPVQVCNEEQTATCPEGQTGDPVTIPAGTFCTMAPNRLPATIAAAQSEMNAEALAAAESELVCTPATTYRIANYCDVYSHLVFTDFAPCAASANPAWDGIFDQVTSSANGPLWYFTNKSVDSKASAASDAPDYPSGDWQDLDFFTQLYFLGGSWFLLIECTGGGVAWWGELDQNDPSNPVGTYTKINGNVSGPATIDIVQVVSGGTNPDWTQLRWNDANVSAIAPASASITPNVNPTFSASFDAQAATPDITQAAAATNDSNLFYTGPLVNCNAHIVLTKSGPDAAQLQGRVLITVDGFTVVDFLVTAHANGTYDIPFIIGNSVCADVQVTVGANISNAGFPAPGDYSVHISGTISTV